MKLKIATHSFTQEEVERLCSLLSERYRGIFSPHRDGEAYHIYSAGNSLRSFIDEIDAFLPPGIERKAYWRQPEVIADPSKHEERRAWHRREGLSIPTEVELRRRELAAEAVILYRTLKSARKVARKLEIEPTTVLRWLRNAGEEILPLGLRDGQLNWKLIHAELEQQVRAASAGEMFKVEQTQTAKGQAMGRGVRALAAAGLLERVKPGVYVRV